MLPGQQDVYRLTKCTLLRRTREIYKEMQSVNQIDDAACISQNKGQIRKQKYYFTHKGLMYQQEKSTKGCKAKLLI